MRRTTWAAAVAAVSIMAAMTPAGASAAAQTVYTIAGGNLLRFSTDAPDKILSSTPITGMGIDAAEGMDFRPSTGELYVVGTNGGLTADLFRLDPATGAATRLTTLVNTLASPGATAFGVDFSPVADVLRVVTNNRNNLRLNPENGTATNDTTLANYPAGDPHVGVAPTLAGLAYAPGATTTTAYAIDSNFNTLVRLGGADGTPSPNGGAVSTIGSGLGLNVSANTGFDIVPSDSHGYITTVVNGVSTLATVDLTTGAVTGSQTINVPSNQLTGAMALGLGGQMSFSTNIAFVSEGDGKVTLTVNRTGGVGSASIDYATADGNAVAGSDYSATSGTLTFGPGDTSKTITIPIINDTVNEKPEAFVVNLSNPKLGSFGDTTTEYVAIVDDDPAPAPPPPPPPPDKTAPTVAIGKVAGRILRAFTVPFACSEPCTARFEVRPSASDRKRYKLSTVIGRASRTLRAAGKGNATVALTKLTRRRLKGVKRLVVTLRVTATDKARNSATLNARLTLKR